MSPRDPLTYPDEPHEKPRPCCTVCRSTEGLERVRVEVTIHRAGVPAQSCSLSRLACRVHWRRVAERLAVCVAHDVPARIASRE